MEEVFLTKMNGKAPAMKVIIKLMDRGANAESIPSQMEISMEMNMNKALTRSALPTLVDITFTFICYFLSSEDSMNFSFSSLSFAIRFFSSMFSSTISETPLFIATSSSSPSTVQVYLLLNFR